MLEILALKNPIVLSINQMRIQKSSQMICGNFRNRPLAKNRLVKPPFYRVQRYSLFANVASFFPQKVHLRSFYEQSKNANNAKTLEKSHLRKSIFSQMIFVSIMSKSTSPRHLYNVKWPSRQYHPTAVTIEPLCVQN